MNLPDKVRSKQKSPEWWQRELNWWQAPLSALIAAFDDVPRPSALIEKALSSDADRHSSSLKLTKIAGDAECVRSDSAAIRYPGRRQQELSPAAASCQLTDLRQRMLIGMIGSGHPVHGSGCIRKLESRKPSSSSDQD